MRLYAPHQNVNRRALSSVTVLFVCKESDFLVAGESAVELTLAYAKSVSRICRSLFDQTPVGGRPRTRPGCRLDSAGHRRPAGPYARGRPQLCRTPSCGWRARPRRPVLAIQPRFQRRWRSAPRPLRKCRPFLTHFHSQRRNSRLLDTNTRMGIDKLTSFGTRGGCSRPWGNPAQEGPHVCCRQIRNASARARPPWPEVAVDHALV
jgi:hypothetical protein